MTFFRLPGIGWLVGTWWAGRVRAAGAIVRGRRGSKIASGKYIARSDVHVLMRFQVILKTLDSTVALIVDSSV